MRLLLQLIPRDTSLRSMRLSNMLRAAPLWLAHQLTDLFKNLVTHYCRSARTSLLTEVSSTIDGGSLGYVRILRLRRNTGRMKHFPEPVLRVMPCCLTS
jgi:hypothetical protein